MYNRIIINLFFFIIFSAIILFNSGCSKEEEPVTPPEINESEILLNYLESNNDYINNSSTFIITASDVNTLRITFPTKLLVIDIRDEAKYSNGHIEGAVRVDFSNLYEYIKTINTASYTKVVIACCAGQTSAYGVSLLRAIGGNTNVFSLKWGMSSWDSTFAQNYWLANISNAYATQFVNTPSPNKNPKGQLPVTLSTGKRTGPEILEARVKELFAAGYEVATLPAISVMQSLNSYYVISYRTDALYLNPGHIPGSINYDPTFLPFKGSNDLTTIPTNKTSVLYCFTGQTSSYVGAYLRLLGYDIKSLTYGSNSMIYDIMLNGNFTNTFIPANEIKGYPYVTGN